MSEQVGPRALLSGLRKQLPRLAERLPEMPDLIYNTMKTFEQGQTKLEMHSQELEEIRKEIKKSNRNLIFAVALGFAAVVATMYFL